MAPDRATEARAAAAQAEPYVAWKQWHAGDFGRFTPREAQQFAAEFAPLLAGRRPARVLEIGFGNGALLGWLREQGHEPVGVELSDELVRRAQAAGVPAFASLDAVPLAADGFDCVAAFDVLEHVPDAALPRLFTDLRALLRPGGALLARFPNGDSPFGRVYQHGDVTHAAVIGHLKVLQLASHAGLELQAFRAPATLGAGAGMRDRVEQRVAALLRGAIERACAALYFSGQRICLAPNAVAVLRRPLT